MENYTAAFDTVDSKDFKTIEFIFGPINLNGSYVSDKVLIIK